MTWHSIRPRSSPRSPPPSLRPTASACSDGHFTPLLLKRRRKPRKRPFSPARLKAALRRRFSRPNGTKKRLYGQNWRLGTQIRRGHSALSSPSASLRLRTIKRRRTSWTTSARLPTRRPLRVRTVARPARSHIPKTCQSLPDGTSGSTTRSSTGISPCHRPTSSWLCLHRFANNRAIPRTIQKISHERIGAACVLDRRTVSKPPFAASTPSERSASWPGVHQTRRKPPHGCVQRPRHVGPPSTDASEGDREFRHEHPDLFLLRPDQARRDRATQRAA